MSRKSQLCGGAFFTLIVKSKTLVANAHEKEKGLSYANSDDDIMLELIRVFYPKFEIDNTRSFHTMTNNYKKCDYEWPKKIPFANDDEMMKLKEQEVSLETVKRMQDFLKKYIREYEISWLINAVTELIENADNLHGNEEWIVAPGCKVASCDIRSKSEIYADWYLAGVWQYIVSTVRKNRIGYDSYTFWYQKDSNEKIYAFTSNIGNNHPMQCEVLWDTLTSLRTEVDKKISEVKEVENEEKKETSVKSSYDIMREQMFKSAQAMADVFGTYMDNLVQTEFKKEKTSEYPNGTDILYESSLMRGKLWQRLENGTITPKTYDERMPLDEYFESEYYEFSKRCSLKTVFIEGEKTIEVIIHANGFDIIGYTSSRNWTSDSSRNRAVGKGTHNLKGIFKVEGIEENSISVQYLYLGEDV